MSRISEQDQERIAEAKALMIDLHLKIKEINDPFAVAEMKAKVVKVIST